MAWYYGHTKGRQPIAVEIFFSQRVPTQRSHGRRYFAVTGPFRSAGHAIHSAQEYRRQTNFDYAILLHPSIKR